MEEWHYLSIQMRIYVFLNLITATWCLIVFAISIFSTDYYRLTDNKAPNWIAIFGLECLKGSSSRWWIERSSPSQTLFELHYIVIFMYTTISIIAISTVPIYSDRLALTEKEQVAEDKKRAKQERKKEKKRSKRLGKKNTVISQSLFKTQEGGGLDTFRTVDEVGIRVKH